MECQLRISQGSTRKIESQAFGHKFSICYCVQGRTTPGENEYFLCLKEWGDSTVNDPLFLSILYPNIVLAESSDLLSWRQASPLGGRSLEICVKLHICNVSECAYVQHS